MLKLTYALSIAVVGGVLLGTAVRGARASSSSVKALTLFAQRRNARRSLVRPTRFHVVAK